jgi:tRNA(Arg) A34 adenosine deaminase TadA
MCEGKSRKVHFWVVTLIISEGAEGNSAEMEHNAAFIGRLVEVVEKDVVPLTDDATKVGNKVFGAAVLNKSDLSLVVAGTNLEMEWPLLHGEMSCLRNMQVRSPLPSLPPSSLVLSHK